MDRPLVGLCESVMGKVLIQRASAIRLPQCSQVRAVLRRGLQKGAFWAPVGLGTAPGAAGRDDGTASSKACTRSRRTVVSRYVLVLCVWPSRRSRLALHSEELLATIDQYLGWISAL